MSFKKIFITLFMLMFLTDMCMAYYIKDDGKYIVVKNKKIVNIIDDTEIKEGEALTPNQIATIVKDNGNINKDY